MTHSHTMNSWFSIPSYEKHQFIVEHDLYSFVNYVTYPISNISAISSLKFIDTQSKIVYMDFQGSNIIYRSIIHYEIQYIKFYFYVIL